MIYYALADDKNTLYASVYENDSESTLLLDDGETAPTLFSTKKSAEFYCNEVNNLKDPIPPIKWPPGVTPKKLHVVKVDLTIFSVEATTKKKASKALPPQK